MQGQVSLDKTMSENARLCQKGARGVQEKVSDTCDACSALHMRARWDERLRDVPVRCAHRADVAILAVHRRANLGRRASQVAGMARVGKGQGGRRGRQQEDRHNGEHVAAYSCKHRGGKTLSAGTSGHKVRVGAQASSSARLDRIKRACKVCHAPSPTHVTKKHITFRATDRRSAGIVIDLTAHVWLRPNHACTVTVHISYGVRTQCSPASCKLVLRPLCDQAPLLPPPGITLRLRWDPCLVPWWTAADLRFRLDTCMQAPSIHYSCVSTKASKRQHVVWSTMQNTPPACFGKAANSAKARPGLLATPADSRAS